MVTKVPSSSSSLAASADWLTAEDRKGKSSLGAVPTELPAEKKNSTLEVLSAVLLTRGTQRVSIWEGLKL